jgi:hypothetical protein
MSASYSASLFVACHSIWRMYLSCFPSREMKRTPTPASPNLSDPSSTSSNDQGLYLPLVVGFPSTRQQNQQALRT